MHTSETILKANDGVVWVRGSFGFVLFFTVFYYFNLDKRGTVDSKPVLRRNANINKNF